MDKAINICLMIFGVLVSYFGFNYGIWVNEGPGGGFLAVLIGVLLIVLCIVALRKNVAEIFKTTEFIKSLVPASAIIITVLLIKVVGFFPAIVIFIFSWLVLVEKYTPVKAFLIDVAISGVLFGIFSLWLRVPFPSGIFF